MRKQKVRAGFSQATVLIDVNQPGEVSDVTTLQDGPIVSSVVDGEGAIPEGTLLYGYVWTGGERIVGHYDRAKLPSGESIPVCFALADRGEQTILKHWGSKAPGTVEIARRVPVVAVRRFEFE